METRVLSIIREIEELGSCAVFSHIERIPPLDEFDPEQCLTEWTIILSTDRGENAIRDVFMFVEDYSEVKIEVIDEENRLDIDEEYKRIGEILYEQGRIKREDLQAIVDRKARFGDLAVKEGLISSNSIESALEEQKFVREARKKRKQQQESSTIRVKSEKLDSLVNLVGELVTLQARLSQYNENLHTQTGHERNEIEMMNETLDRLTADLRDTTMDIRMVPLAETFNTFQRLVCDLSSELGKEVSLESTGAETELDKNIIDELNDPLIIRIEDDEGGIDLETDKPEVIVLDIEMPNMDGLTFLQKIMSENPLPVIIIDAVIAASQAKLNRRAKPASSSGAAAAPSGGQGAPAEKKHTADIILPRSGSQRSIETTERVIVVGASTGGTEALRVFLEMMPMNSPPIVIVQHMPEKFTTAFASRLNTLCEIEVKEAENNDTLRRGRALIAPGNRHTLLKRSGARYYVEVKEGPLVSRHRPSVDVLFRSASRYGGKNIIGIIMTGMGDDGASGMAEMKETGAYTIAQDEKSSVVFGMPNEAIKRGAVDEVISLDAIAGRALEIAKK